MTYLKRHFCCWWYIRWTVIKLVLRMPEEIKDWELTIASKMKNRGWHDADWKREHLELITSLFHPLKVSFKL